LIAPQNNSEDLPLPLLNISTKTPKKYVSSALFSLTLSLSLSLFILSLFTSHENNLISFSLFQLVLKAVAETTAIASKLIPLAKLYSENPNDPNKFRDLLATSKQLQDSLQGLLGALGKEAAESNLRDAARRCAASLAKYHHFQHHFSHHSHHSQIIARQTNKQTNTRTTI
jgi:hypothetical protein